MAEFSVHEWKDGEQRPTDMYWEEESYREGCAYARELAERRLKAIDDDLMRSRPEDMRLVGFRQRTLVTRFGDVVVRRRMYRDSNGSTVFALDEHLGWKPQQQASVSMTQSVVEMATEMPFRVVTRSVSSLTAGVLSKSTVHRLLQGVAQNALDEERERWESQFERGEDVSEGRHSADILYTEADGVWIHLQREKRTHHEVRSAIAYRGWRRLSEDRYELVGKRVYAHGDDAVPFWEGASLEWAKHYALDRVKLFVVGGDGANWIRRGADELGNSIFQLDGFHLSRACGRGYGPEMGSAIYDAIRAGSEGYARALMSAAEEAETKTATRDRLYVESNTSNGVDWRNRVPNAPADARSLGTMESNGDKLTAKRMKKRGMSWTIRGASRMAKTIQLSRNTELPKYCRRRPTLRPALTGRRPHRHSRTANRPRTSDWAEMSVPALNGPHNSKPWTVSLKRLLRNAY